MVEGLLDVATDLIGPEGGEHEAIDKLGFGIGTIWAFGSIHICST